MSVPEYVKHRPWSVGIPGKCIRAALARSPGSSTVIVLVLYEARSSLAYRRRPIVECFGWKLPTHAKGALECLHREVPSSEESVCLAVSHNSCHIGVVTPSKGLKTLRIVECQDMESAKTEHQVYFNIHMLDLQVSPSGIRPHANMTGIQYHPCGSSTDHNVPIPGTNLIKGDDTDFVATSDDNKVIVLLGLTGLGQISKGGVSPFSICKPEPIHIKSLAVGQHVAIATYAGGKKMRAFSLVRNQRRNQRCNQPPLTFYSPDTFNRDTVVVLKSPARVTAISSDDRYIAVACADETIQLWKHAAEDCYKPLPQISKCPAKAIRFFSYGDLAVITEKKCYYFTASNLARSGRGERAVAGVESMVAIPILANSH